MTPSVYNFVKRLRDEGKLEGRVLDVGSRDVNGSVRDLFPEGYYTGTDKVAGKNVDYVADFVNDFDVALYTALRHSGDALESADNVLCLEMIEHTIDPGKAVRQITRLLQNGGRLVLTTRGIGYPLHDEPEDYYRFTEYAMRHFFEGFLDVEIVVAENGMGVYGVGRKA